MIQTVTLEQSKQIKDLGIEISTYFIFAQHMGKWEIFRNKDTSLYTNAYDVRLAPTAEEMLDRMPKHLHNGSHLKYQLTILPTDNFYHISYMVISINKWLHVTKNKSLSVAVGDMFIWCAENKHLEVK